MPRPGKHRSKSALAQAGRGVRPDSEAREEEVILIESKTVAVEDSPLAAPAAELVGLYSIHLSCCGPAR